MQEECCKIQELENSFHKNINTDKKPGMFYHRFWDKQLFKLQKDVFLYLG